MRGIAVAISAGALLSGAALAQAPAPRPAPIDRGQALVEGMGCLGCHSPLQGPAWSGMRVGNWLAPNITPDPVSGIGAWSRDEVVAYLRTGKAKGRAQAAGPMAGIVEGMRDTPQAEFEAAATWLAHLAPVRDPADTAPASSRDATGPNEAALRGAPSAEIARSGFRLLQANAGAELFNGNCASCHGRDGAGSADGAYPSLSRNSAVGRRDPTNLIATVLWGVERRTQAGEAYMPAFGRGVAVASPLNDDEVAAVVNEVLTRFGDPDATAVTSDTVAAMRGVR